MISVNFSIILWFSDLLKIQTSEEELSSKKMFIRCWKQKYRNDPNKRPGRLLNFWIFYMGA